MLRKFRKRPLLPGAFADRPLNFMSLAELEDLANITAVDLIENGDRAVREHWQNKQLTNLLRHAQARSAFWRQRMPPQSIGHGIIANLPIQSREDVVTQVSLEGCLATTDGAASMLYASSGSTGTPV